MSLEARRALVNSPRTRFQSALQRADLLDPAKTQTQLVALLLELVQKGHNIAFTAIRSDHGDDSALGRHCHANGFAADCWPLASTAPGDYLAAADPRFQLFLFDAAASQWIHQIGLGGSAQTDLNFARCGGCGFADNGADHVHLGANG